MPLILAVYEGNPLYFEHCPPRPTAETVLGDMKKVPKDKTYDDKYDLGLFEAENLVAVLDLITHFPDRDTAGYVKANRQAEHFWSQNAFLPIST